MRATTCAGLAMTAIVCVAAGAAAETKVSGTVVHAEEGGRTFVIEELGVAGWPVRRVIDAAAGAPIVELTRDGAGTAPGEWPGGYEARRAEGVRPGDFVTVTLGDAASRARTVEIVRPSGEAAASPRTTVDMPPRR